MADEERLLLDTPTVRKMVAKIKKYLTTVPDCFFWKEHGGMYGTAGIPDIIACIKGHFFGFEVKTDGTPEGDDPENPQVRRDSGSCPLSR